MSDEFDRGYNEAVKDMRAMAWHFLNGQASAEASQGKTYARGEPKFRQTLYIRDALDRFLRSQEQ